MESLLCIFFVQTYYTTERSIRHFLFQKVVKWCFLLFHQEIRLDFQLQFCLDNVLHILLRVVDNPYGKVRSIM